MPVKPMPMSSSRAAARSGTRSKALWKVVGAPAAGVEQRLESGAIHRPIRPQCAEDEADPPAGGRSDRPDLSDRRAHRGEIRGGVHEAARVRADHDHQVGRHGRQHGVHRLECRREAVLVEVRAELDPVGTQPSSCHGFGGRPGAQLDQDASVGGCMPPT